VKKHGKNILILVIALAILVVLAPRFLQLEALQNRIVDFLSSRLESRVTIEMIHWDWLPLPHVSLHNTTIANDEATFFLPETRLFPHWKIFFLQLEKAGRIHLLNPQGRLHLTKDRQETGTVTTFPAAKLTIENGTFDIDIEDSDIVELRHGITLSGVQANIRSKGSTVSWKVETAAPFSNRITASGAIDLGSHVYSLDFDCRALNLYKAIAAAAGDRIRPLDSPVNLTGHMQGEGLKKFRSELQGEFPGFAVRYLEKDILFNCGRASLILQKEEGDFSLAIDEFELKKPALRLSGIVKRSVRADGGGENPPLWRIDLKAAQADLAATRKEILAVFGSNRIAHIVCNVVRGGTAKQAGFFFEGPVSGFHDIDNITVTAEVQNAPIHVPAAQLDLTQVSGGMKIENGILSGFDLSGQLGNSRGKNGLFSLALHKHGRAFSLDVEIDADIADIPPVLHNLIRNKPFIAELNKFSAVRGRAAGRLKLGDTLDDIAVDISVSGMDAAMKYDRLPWPVRADSGRLEIRPGEVRWHGLQGEIGPHRISRSAGAVTWDDQVHLALDQLTADVDAAPLYSFLLSNSLLPASLRDDLESVSGRLEILEATLRGPVRNPGEWEYLATVRSDELTVITPHLPEQLVVETLAASIDQGKIVLSQARLPLAENSLHLQGKFSHHLLDNWQGQVDLSGTIPARYDGWLRANKIIPAPFTPRLPGTLRDMRITWSHEQTRFKGTILPGTGADDANSLQLDILSTPAALHVKNLAITGPGEHGNLSLELSGRDGRTLSLSWQGVISAESVNAFLATDLIGGSLIGDFALRVPPPEKETASATGSLLVKGLTFLWGTRQVPIHIKNLIAKGKDGAVEVVQLDLDVAGETARVRGEIAPQNNNLRLSFLLAADNLTWENISRLASELDNLEMKPLPWDLIGVVDFVAEQFSAEKKVFNIKPTEGKATYDWRQLQGRIKLHPADKTSIEVNKAELCTMDMQGIWDSDGDKTILHVDSAPLPFDDVLPCLGLGHNLLSGKFTFKADLQGSSGRWTDGQATILSEQGTLLRMALLSKIFSVINLTDLFFPQDNGHSPSGLPYSRMEITATIKDDKAFIDRGVLFGEGLNLFGSGHLDLSNYETDITLFIAPLKSVDTVMKRIPLVGRIIGGDSASLVTIPVSIKGPLADPDIQPLSPGAIGEATLNLVRETLNLPFKILNPVIHPGKPIP